MAKYPTLAPFAAASDVIILGTSWDAWVYGKTVIFGLSTNMINWPGAPYSITTTYGYRQNCKSDGTGSTWYPDQDFEQNRANMLSAAGMDRWYLWYPNRADVSSGPVPDQSDIYDVSIAYYLNTDKPHKYAIIAADYWGSYDANTPHTWLNFTAFVNRWVTLFQDPHYRKVSDSGGVDRPVFGLYRNGTVNWSSTQLDELDAACVAAGLGPPYYVQMTANVTVANTLGCDAITSYGPNGTLPPGGGHRAYADQITTDVTIDVLTGANEARLFPIVHTNDNRPLNYGTDTDVPIYTQFEQHWRDRFALARSNMHLNPLHIVVMYSVTEVEEGGDFFPTLQTITRGVNTPSRGMFLDAIKNVRDGTFPSTYDDHYHARSFHANVGASFPAGWALVQNLTGASGATTGAYQYAELQNSTTTNARTWTVTGTRVRVYGGMRAGLGTIRFVLDGGANNDVVQGSLVGTGYNQLLYDTGTISNTSHTVAISRVSGTVGFDEVVVTVSR